jgi:hypothetical protein
VNRRGIGDTPFGEPGREPARDEWLANPTEPEAGQRDAELRGGERRVEIVGGLEGELHLPAARLGQGPELAGAHFDQRKLGRDEEPVRRHEEEDEQDLEGDGDGFRHTAAVGRSKR